MKNWTHTFVVYRLDFKDDTRIIESVTIKSVHDSLEEAKEEVSRLNKLNSHLGCEYHCQVAKKPPDNSHLGQFQDIQPSKL